MGDDHAWEILQQWIAEHSRTCVRLHLTTPAMIQLALRCSSRLRGIGLQMRFFIEMGTMKPVAWLEPLSISPGSDD